MARLAANAAPPEVTIIFDNCQLQSVQTKVQIQQDVEEAQEGAEEQSNVVCLGVGFRLLLPPTSPTRPFPLKSLPSSWTSSPESFFLKVTPLLYRHVCLNARNAPSFLSGLDTKWTDDELKRWDDGAFEGKGEAGKGIAYLGLVRKVELEDEHAFHACMGAVKGIEKYKTQTRNLKAAYVSSSSDTRRVLFSLFWGVNHKLSTNVTLVWSAALCEWLQQQDSLDFASWAGRALAEPFTYQVNLPNVVDTNLSRVFHIIQSDNTVWKRSTLVDFHLSGEQFSSSREYGRREERETLISSLFTRHVGPFDIVLVNDNQIGERLNPFPDLLDFVRVICQDRFWIDYGKTPSSSQEDESFSYHYIVLADSDYPRRVGSVTLTPTTFYIEN
ncbi:hypothetical protein IAR50_001171 [Cryptococcus sp. DSM 104548]